MMQSISHWGQFEMQAAGTENFKERVTKILVRADSLVAEEAARQHRPTSFFVSRQDKPEDPKLHQFY